MQTLLVILIILASILLSFFVLIQNPKGGGLVSGFAGGTNIMGVKRTGDFLEKATWGLVIAIIVMSMAMNILPASSGSGGSGRAGDIEVNMPMNTLPLGTGEVPAETAPATEEAPSASDSNDSNE